MRLEKAADCVFGMAKVVGKRFIGVSRPQNFKKINISELSYKPLRHDLFSPKLPNVFKGLTHDEIAQIKPSQFKSIINNRKDIHTNIIRFLDTPDKLALYDDLAPLLKKRNLKVKDINIFYKTTFSDLDKVSDCYAKREVLPKLLEKGYDTAMLSRLPVTHLNKNQIENILLRKEDLYKMWGAKYDMHLFEIKDIPEIVRYVDDSNIKYLDECIQLTHNPQNLIFWNDNSAGILKKFGHGNSLPEIISEKIHRRKLSYEEVADVAKGRNFCNDTSELLEFKGYKKLKNIGLDDLDKLSVQEKKDLLSGFISVISPYRLAAWQLQNLAPHMKIFSEINISSVESMQKDYYKIIRSILNSIPKNERATIMKSTPFYKGGEKYMTYNPIPSMVDDLSKLATEDMIVKGKKIKVARLDKDTDLNLAIHWTKDQKSILNMEALEMTNSEEFICTGLRKSKNFDGIEEVSEFIENGLKADGLHFKKGIFGLAVKPRNGGDVFIQAATDIWSDGFMKTPYNMIRGTQAHLKDKAASYVPELIKKELNLSQKEYTFRMKKIADATTLDEIAKIDCEMANTIRKISKDYPMFEGIIRPKTMGCCIDANIPLDEISDDVLNYCELRNIPLIRITGY